MDKYGDFHDGSLEGFWVDNPLVHIFLKIDVNKRPMELSASLSLPTELWH